MDVRSHGTNVARGSSAGDSRAPHLAGAAALVVGEQDTKRGVVGRRRDSKIFWTHPIRRYKNFCIGIPGQYSAFQLPASDANSDNISRNDCISRVLKSLLFASKREREGEHLSKRVAMHIRAHASVFEPNQVPRNVGLEVVGHGFAPLVVAL